MLLDFLPLLVLYAVWWAKDIYAATAAGMLSSAIVIGWTLLQRKPVRRSTWLSFGLFMVFGGFTLFLHDTAFLRVKPTILYWLFALVLGLSPRLAGRNFIRSMLERDLRLTDVIWQRVNDSWAAFFALLGGLNLLIAFQFSEAVWLTYKVFGTIVLMVIFVVVQGVMLQRHVQNGDGPG